MMKAFYSTIQILCHQLSIPFELKFYFLSYPSFGIKIESKKKKNDKNVEKEKWSQEKIQKREVSRKGN